MLIVSSLFREIASFRRDYKTIIANSGSLFLLQFLGTLLPLLTFPYLTRVLGESHFGMFAFAQSVIQYFILVTDYGFSLSATRVISIHRDDQAKRSQLFASTLFAKTLLLLGGYIVLIPAVLVIPPLAPYADLIFILSLSVIGTVLFPIWLYQGLEKMRLAVVFQIIGRVGYVCGILGFVNGPDDLLLAAFFFSFSLLITGILGVVFAYPTAGLQLSRPLWDDVITQFQEGREVFFSLAGSSLFSNSTIFILGLFAPMTEVGRYSIAERIIRVCMMMTTPITQAIYPHTALLFSRSRQEGAVFLKRILYPSAFGLIGCSLLLILFSDDIVTLVTGTASTEISFLLSLLAILPLTVFIDNLYGTQVLLNIGQQRRFMKIILYSGVFSVVASLLFVPYFFSVATAWVYLLTEFIVLILMIRAVHREGIRLH